MKIESIQLAHYPPRVKINCVKNKNVIQSQELHLPHKCFLPSWQDYLLNHSRILKYYEEKLSYILDLLLQGQNSLNNKQFKLLKQHIPHICQTTSISLSSSHIVSTGYEGNVIISDTQLNNELHFNTQGPTFCSSLQNNYLVIGSLDGFVRVFDLTLRQKFSVQNKEQSPILCCDFKENKLAYGLENGQAVVYDIEDKQYVKLQQHAQEVVQILLLGEYCYTAGFDGQVFRNDLRDLKTTSRLTTGSNSSGKTFQSFNEPILCIKIVNQLMLIASTSEIRIVNLNNGRAKMKINGNNIKCADLAWNGSVLYSDIEQTKVINCEQKIEFECKKSCEHALFLNPGADQNLILVAKGQIMFKTENGSTDVIGNGADVTGIEASRNGLEIVCSRSDGSVEVYTTQ
ncbi:Ciliary_BBSome complex subunit 2 [Hexamita inflata]|uniref:Middle region n=1 Tax=Hexamita inflata TaxID=28002 RepID=A0AA86PUV8_9EUKA|nr:Ciliary BBSome complex subunit 2 [Hexamita inflata]CAI9945261.1 Ciliary BBSome complex subunit 2 [Hexamita inflata]